MKQKTMMAALKMSDGTKEQARKTHKNQKHRKQTVVYSRVFAGRKFKY